MSSLQEAKKADGGKDKPAITPGPLTVQTPTTAFESGTPPGVSRKLAGLRKPSARMMTPQNLLAYQQTLGNQATRSLIARYKQTGTASPPSPASIRVPSAHTGNLPPEAKTPAVVQRHYSGVVVKGDKIWWKPPIGDPVEVVVESPADAGSGKIVVRKPGLDSPSEIPRSELFATSEEARKAPVTSSQSGPALDTGGVGASATTSLAGNDGSASEEKDTLPGPELINNPKSRNMLPVESEDDSSDPDHKPGQPNLGPGGNSRAPRNMLEAIDQDLYKGIGVAEGDYMTPEAPPFKKPTQANLSDPQFILYLRDADKQAHQLRLGIKKIYVLHDFPWWRYFVITYYHSTEKTPFPGQKDLENLYGIYQRNKATDTGKEKTKQGKLKSALNFIKSLSLDSLKRLFVDPFLNLGKAKDLGKLWHKAVAYYKEAKGTDKGTLHTLAALALTFLKAASEFINVLNDLLAAIGITVGILGLALSWNPVGGALLGIAGGIGALMLWTTAIQAGLEALRLAALSAAALQTKDARKKHFLYGQAKEAGLRSLKGMISFFFGGFGNFFGGMAGAVHGGDVVSGAAAFNPLGQMQGASVGLGTATHAASANMGVIVGTGMATGVPMSHDEENLGEAIEGSTYKGFKEGLRKARQEQAQMDTADKPAAKEARKIPVTLEQTSLTLIEVKDLDLDEKKKSKALEKGADQAHEKATQLVPIEEATSGTGK